MVFPRWTWSWSPLAAFLRWPSALIARVAAAVLWLWSTQAKKGSVAPDIEGGLEGLDVKEVGHDRLLPNAGFSNKLFLGPCSRTWGEF